MKHIATIISGPAVTPIVYDPMPTDMTPQQIANRWHEGEQWLKFFLAVKSHFSQVKEKENVD